MKPKIVVGHLYPEYLNIYADRGNMAVLERRAAWRGIGFDYRTIGLGEEANPDEYDLYYVGGGQDREQALVAPDLATKGESLREAVDGGAAFLAVCGGYQLLGRFYRDRSGAELPVENHAGRTYLDEGAEPLGRVVAGFGNNGEDGVEGSRVGSALGTYLHGPLLPRNPWLADWLIGRALSRRLGDTPVLESLPDDFESSAQRVSAERARARGGRF